MITGQGSGREQKEKRKENKRKKEAREGYRRRGEGFSKVI